MKEELYSLLKIDKQADLKTVLKALEEKQFEYLNRLETARDENRRKEISDILKQIEEEVATVKEKIKSINTSIILDASNDGTYEKKEAEVKAEAEKKEKITGKVDAIKQKEAEKKAKAAEKAAQEQQANTSQNNAQSTPASNAPAPAPVKQVSNTGADITNGINSYMQQDYANAFKVFKELSEKGDGSAQYMISVMYLHGLGISKDIERSLFWLKKSAESGEPAGQAAYGGVLVSGNDEKDINTGFKYLLMASEKGDTDAMLDYVQACLGGKGGKNEITKAIDYCEKLKLASEDSFNKKKFDDAKALLQKMKKTGRKKSGASNAYGGGYGASRSSITSRILLIIIICIIVMAFVLVMAEISEDRRRNDIARTSSQVSSQVSSAISANSSVIEQQPVFKKVRVIVEEGNVRSGAGTEYDVVTSVHLGEEYIATEKTETAGNGQIWYEIFLDENKTSTGWMSGKIAEIHE